jgi:hypothetical protein
MVSYPQNPVIQKRIQIITKLKNAPLPKFEQQHITESSLSPDRTRLCF